MICPGQPLSRPGSSAAPSRQGGRTFIEARSFGTTAEAERAGRRVRKIHESLTGTDPDGTRYRVDEPELLLWVHCGEVASCADIARRSRLPFSAADLDAFVDEQRDAASFAGGTIVVRADSAYYSAAFYATVRRAMRPVLDHVEDRPEDRRGHRLGVSGGLTVAGVAAAAAPVGLG
jgi:hypothetical protein